jgi:toxin ParE1/3/4
VRIEWRPAARADLFDLVSYIALDSLSAAVRMHDAITAAVQGLPAHPLRGRPGRMDGTRELVVPQTPYVVVYSASATVIEVLRVLHGARQWPPAR